MSASVDLAEFRAAYVAEVGELLDAVNARLLAAEANARTGAPSPREIREVFRGVHTVKGLSAMVGLEPVVLIAHRMESWLRAADRAGGHADAHAIDTLLHGVRAIEQRVSAFAQSRTPSDAPPALLEALDALEAPTEKPAPAGSNALTLDPAVDAKLTPGEREQLQRAGAEGRRAIRVDFSPSPERAALGVTINAVRERLAALGEIVRVIPMAGAPSAGAPGGLTFAILLTTTAADAAIAEALGPGVEPPRALAPPAPPAVIPSGESDPAEDTSARNNAVVRVSVDRLDDAMERLSALMVGRSRLARAIAALTATGADTRELVQIASENARQLRDLRAAILRVRMVPVSELLERVPLVVRGLRRSSGKQVRVEMDTGSAELDKAVAERVFPAVLHLLRNAVDHGIEAPDERSRAGKNPEGTLRIACTARPNSQLELSIADDGRGVDGEALAARAGREVPHTDAELLDLLCTPGLSSREQASDTSGRGMGMDIVRRIVVHQLGGELNVRSVRGAGTTFTLRVPLTVSVVDAFAFECAGQRFVVPVGVVDEVVEVDPASVAPLPSRRGERARGDIGLITRLGTAMPLIPLRGLLGLPAGEQTHSTRALVVRRGESIAFGVDRMLGQQEAVLRPLEDPLVRVPGVSAATDLGDGRPTLVLDLMALAARAFGRGGERAA